MGARRVSMIRLAGEEGGMDPDWLRRGAPPREALIDEGCLITELVNGEHCPGVSLALARCRQG
jgi:hypothetical protein